MVAIGGCADDDSASSSRTIPGPAGGGGVVPAPVNNKNVLGTATVTVLDRSKVGALPEAYCNALLEFDNKYGPLHQPQLTIKSFPDAIRLFKIMYANAPADVKTRLEEPIATADKLQAAIDAGVVTDEASSKVWVDQNLGKEGLQKFLASMLTVLYFSAPECGVGKEKR